jgi:surface carbohydrate biosynthesis protein (TIGR04326 family)
MTKAEINVYDNSETAGPASGLLWEGASPHHISLDRFVKENALNLRNEFLESISQLERNNIAGFLEANHLPSLWWLSELASRGSFAPEYLEIIKLLALDQICRDLGKTPLYCGDYERLRSIFENRLEPISFTTIIKNIFKAFVFPFWFYFRFGRHTAGFRKTRPQIGPNRNLTYFFSFFPNVNVAALEQNIFRSNYWGPLHEKLESSQAGFVLQIASEGQFSIKDCFKKLRRLRENPQQKIWTIEEFIGFGTTVRASVHILFALPKVLRMHRKVFEMWRTENLHLSLFNFVAKTQLTSLTGPAACLNISKWIGIRNFVKYVPADSSAVHMFENQPWEVGLAANWRKAGLGKVFGFMHVPVRPLDFRMFTKPSQLRPLPDRFLVVGENSKNLLENYGSKNVSVVESVRNLHLLNLKPSRQEQPKLIVLLALNARENRRLLFSLAELQTSNLLQSYPQIVIKAHPFLNVNPEDYGLPAGWLTEFSVAEVIRKGDVVIACNSTTSILEALYITPYVAVLSPEQTLDQSVLHGHKVTAIENLEQFIDFIQTPKLSQFPKEMFCFDEKLSAWSGVLTEAKTFSH